MFQNDFVSGDQNYAYLRVTLEALPGYSQDLKIAGGEGIWICHLLVVSNASHHLDRTGSHVVRDNQASRCVLVSCTERRRLCSDFGIGENLRSGKKWKEDVENQNECAFAVSDTCM